MADEPDLVGKKKVVVDESAFVNIYRSPNQQGLWPGEFVAQNAARASLFNGTYLPFDPAVDKVRALLGKSWDHRKKEPSPDATHAAAAAEAQLNEDPTEKIFSNKWHPVRCFGKFPLELEFCGEQTTHEVDQDQDWVGSPYKTPKIASIQDKIVLKCEPRLPFNMAPNIDHLSWVYFVKTGLLAAGVEHQPVVDTQRFFYDHYHETHLPFTPDELINKQPVGKAYYADYKTSYNETIRSGYFEDVTGLRDDIQNSLPTPYGFLKLANNTSLLENESLDLNNILAPIKNLYENSMDAPSTVNPAGLYTDILKQYPLETLATLYGVVGTGLGNILAAPPEQYDLGGLVWSEKEKLIEKIITLNHDKVDISGLFEEYINQYAKYLGEPEFAPHASFHGRITALENKFSNLVFSPNVTPIMSKVEKYKKYFPFSVDLEFGAKLSTSLGDSMKKLFMTRVMSHMCVTAFPNHQHPLKHAFLFPGVDTAEHSFINYTQENIYKTLDGAMSLEYSVSPYRSGAEPKTTFSFPETVNGWINNSGYYAYKEHLDEAILDADADNPEDVYLPDQDVRNFTTFFQDDTNEPISLDDPENEPFKKLFGSVFYGKIVDIYNKKGRTYQEILNGKPAYTEDLFYRIKKERKLTDEGSTWETVQNVLIPNTSDLDIVKYVDTQLKYSTHATYKYTVYTERVVFGSAYRYHWNRQEAEGHDDDPLPHGTPRYGPAQPPLPGSSMQPEIIPEVWYEDTTKDTETLEQGFVTIVTGAEFTATFNVRVHPSIQVIEDRLFETPEILVMDRPPVRPDVNIVPYRAINNRIKILLTGNVDRRREKPVIILDSDKAEFKKVKDSQLSFDGKVEFASDDSVTKFQIFRIEEKPKSYSDFKGALYRELDSFVFEEKIMPNTKYYYTFRAKDPHNHLSNPTEVYEVELIDEKGAVKPIIRLVSMDPIENKSNIKECQKYIYVKPALKQLYFSQELGSDGVFSQPNKKKKYKMRITSKGSGKKIDINFSFIKKQSD
tara:strand:- start:5012 stop:8041 length:3030 start_codon:yes stop_codon:yes gene_type:complete